MAKNSTLYKIGMLLVLIGAVLAIILPILGLIKISVLNFPVYSPLAAFNTYLFAAISIISGIILLQIYLRKLKLEGIMLSIVIILIAWVGNASIALIGGIVLLVDRFI